MFMRSDELSEPVTGEMISTNTMLTRAVTAMGSFTIDALHRKQAPTRVARAVFSLLQAGCSAYAQAFQTIAEHLYQNQQPDGGWSDPAETAWAAGTICLVQGQEDPAVQSAIHWLNNVRLPTGGWGRHSRDQARIPITALISCLVPAAFKSEDINWLRNEWARDFRGPVRLSYKAGFYLLAMPKGRDDELVGRTIAHLADDQNDDGGFAPWKGHPIGSDPWSTGVVLWGLSRWGEHVNHAVLENALNWLQETQLPSGYWPYHYLDDGTSLALIGSVAALKSLKVRK